jgi:predicted N-acetyltransferase YhbS
MVKGKWFPQGHDLSVPLALRQAVFARSRDALDDMAQQVVVYDGSTPVGAARLWWADGAFHLGDVGVLPSARGRGFGDLLTRLALFKAMTHHAARVELVAPEEIAPFFTRYGFLPADTPSQDTLPAGGYVPMAIDGQAIALSHCGKDCAACLQGGTTP